MCRYVVDAEGAIELKSISQPLLPLAPPSDVVRHAETLSTFRWAVDIVLVGAASKAAKGLAPIAAPGNLHASLHGQAEVDGPGPRLEVPKR